jgi:hypothetical protein
VFERLTRIELVSTGWQPIIITIYTITAIIYINE